MKGYFRPARIERRGVYFYGYKFTMERTRLSSLVTTKNTINLKVSFKNGIRMLENESNIIRSAASHDNALISDINTPIHIPPYQVANPIGNR